MHMYIGELYGNTFVQLDQGLVDAAMLQGATMDRWHCLVGAFCSIHSNAHGRIISNVCALNEAIVHLGAS